MVSYTLKTLQYSLQDFWSVSDHFGTLPIKGLISKTLSIRNRQELIKCDICCIFSLVRDGLFLSAANRWGGCFWQSFFSVYPILRDDERHTNSVDCLISFGDIGICIIILQYSNTFIILRNFFFFFFHRLCYVAITRSYVRAMLGFLLLSSQKIATIVRETANS